MSVFFSLRFSLSPCIHKTDKSSSIFRFSVAAETCQKNEVQILTLDGTTKVVVFSRCEASGPTVVIGNSKVAKQGIGHK